MHKEILNDNQLELLPLVQKFKREFYLVGGTAIALHIGHRRSIDFDLFKAKRLNINKIINKISDNNYSYTVSRRVEEQLNLIINDVMFTFLEYPFPIKSEHKFESFIKLPSLLQLSAMKAYALGRRSKWKDYVDLFFIMKNYYSISEVIQEAKSVFKDLFSEKLFRAQLCFFDDMDYSEEVDFTIENPPSNEEIQDFLREIAIDI
jgi:hypothetical protein